MRPLLILLRRSLPVFLRSSMWRRCRPRRCRTFSIGSLLLLTIRPLLLLMRWLNRPLRTLRNCLRVLHRCRPFLRNLSLLMRSLPFRCRLRVPFRRLRFGVAVRVADAALVPVAPVEAGAAAREAQVAFSRGHGPAGARAGVPAVHACRLVPRGASFRPRLRCRLYPRCH